MYAVIVCPKCRIFAQIIEYDPNKKTTKCKNCNVVLKIKRLKIFYKSDVLYQAISARTQIQANLHNQKKDNILTFDSIESREPSLPKFIDVHKRILKKDERKMILTFLNSIQKEICIRELKECMIDQGADGEKFDKAISNLLQFGEIYSPKKGVVKIV